MSEDRRRSFLPNSPPMTREESIRAVYEAIIHAEIRQQQKEEQRSTTMWIVPEKREAPQPPMPERTPDVFDRAAANFYRGERLRAELQADHEIAKLDRAMQVEMERIEKKFARERARLTRVRALKALRDCDEALRGTKYWRR